MNMLLALVLSLQEAPAPQEASGLVFTAPKGWTRRTDEATKATVLVPPDAGPQASVILYPPTPDVTGTAQEAHDKMFRALTGAGTVEGAPQTGTTGIFQWTRVAMNLPGNPAFGISLYTTKSGTTAAIAVFAAPEALFRKHLPDVEKLVQELDFAGPLGPQAIHGVLLRLPPGWTRKDDPKGPTALTPAPPAGPLEPRWDYLLYVLPSRPLRGTHWETHKAAFEEALRATQLKDPVAPRHESDEAGPFIRSASAGRDAAGRVIAVSMYSARSEDAIECLLIHGQEDRDGLRAILSRAAVRNPPRKAERPRIVEAYRRAGRTQYLEGGLGSLQYERIWLRADGVADFTTSYPDGHAASPEVLKYDSGLLNGRIGSWKARGDGRLEILRTAGAGAQTYERDGGGLRLGDQVWQPMPPIDGLRLEGRWGMKTISISFAREGRFKDDGVAAHVALPRPNRPKPPKQGEGTYEIREWTLFLRYDDGTSWSSDFSTIGADPADLSSILLSTWAFRRE